MKDVAKWRNRVRVQCAPRPYNDSKKGPRRLFFFYVDFYVSSDLIGFSSIRKNSKSGRVIQIT